MKHINTGNAAKMLAFAKAAFLIRSAQTGSTGASKRHPLGESETGPEAAEHYRMKRRLTHSARSLRKIDRYHRIFNGDAPRKHDVPGRREAKIIKRAEAREPGC